MNIVTTTKTSKFIQSWSGDGIPLGYAIVPDDFDTSEFYAYNGFVDLTIDDTNTVTAMTPNVEAWEAWKASQPEEAETEPESPYVTWDDLASAIEEGVNEV